MRTPKRSKRAFIVTSLSSALNHDKHFRPICPVSFGNSRDFEVCLGYVVDDNKRNFLLDIAGNQVRFEPRGIGETRNFDPAGIGFELAGM